MIGEHASADVRALTDSETGPTVGPISEAISPKGADMEQGVEALVRIFVASIIFAAAAIAIAQCRTEPPSADGRWDPVTSERDIGIGVHVNTLWATTPDPGVRCYASVGVFHDSLSCVVVPDAEAKP